jgi:arylsulfatase A-like enzyme
MPTVPEIITESILKQMEQGVAPWRKPWSTSGGGTYFTAMEASLRAPFIMRWSGKVPAGRVSNEIVHIVDMYPTLARVGGAEVP